MVLVDAPFRLFAGAAVPFDVMESAGLPRRVKVPFFMPSNDNGTGGGLVFHMSAIERRFNMSEWNTCNSHSGAGGSGS